MKNNKTDKEKVLIFSKTSFVCRNNAVMDQASEIFVGLFGSNSSVIKNETKKPLEVLLITFMVNKILIYRSLCSLEQLYLKWSSLVQMFWLHKYLFWPNNPNISMLCSIGLISIYTVHQSWTLDQALVIFGVDLGLGCVYNE